MTSDDVERLVAEVVRPIADHAREQSSHLSTILRWITRGAKRPDGRRVTLEAVRRPGGCYTSAAAITRFLAQLTERPGAETPAPKMVSQVRRDSEAAERELMRQGA